MKTALLAAAIGLALAPAAHAQAVCGDIARFSDFALNDFDDIIDEEIGDELYSSTEEFANADECGVSYEFDSTFVCMWVYDNVASAGAAYSGQVSALAPCLTSGWRPGDASIAEPANGITPLRKAVYDGEGDNADLEWTVLMEEHNDSTIHDWHVWVAISYLW